MTALLIEYIWLVLIFPLLGFVAIGFLHTKLSEKVIGWLGTAAVFLSFLFSLILFIEVIWFQETAFAETRAIYSWLSTAEVDIKISFMIDHLTLVMLLVVTGVGCLIHIYAMGFMGGQKGFTRIFAFMNLSIFFVLLLVLADNFLLVLSGWSGINICSYLLISLNYEQDTDIQAGKKIFIFSRFADFLLVLAVLFVFSFFKTFDFEQIFRTSIRTISEPGLTTTICLLLTFAVACKAAMVPFHVWARDAVIAPIPVSVLLTGLFLSAPSIYLIARCHVLFLQSPMAMSILSIVGLFTAFLAATIAATSDDVKRVLAYAAVSQIGFMFLALGVGAFDSAIFHLLTQAIVIPLFFISIGNLEYSAKEIKTGVVLRQKIPSSYRIFLIGALTLSGTPMLSGFFSRNEILWRTLGSQPLGGFVFWLIGVLISGLTVFYIFRSFFHKFYTEPAPTKNPVAIKRLKPTMSIPLYIFAFLAFAVGLLGLPHHSKLKNFLEPVFTNYVKTDLFDLEPQMLPLEISFTAIVILVSLIGFGFSYLLYFVKPEMPGRILLSTRPLNNFITHNWYMDELYQSLLLKPARYLANISVQLIDVKILDKIRLLIPQYLETLSVWLNKLQTGLIRNYILSFVLSIVMIFAYFLLKSN